GVGHERTARTPACFRQLARPARRVPQGRTAVDRDRPHGGGVGAVGRGSVPRLTDREEKTWHCPSRSWGPPTTTGPRASTPTVPRSTRPPPTTPTRPTSRASTPRRSSAWCRPG